MKSEINLFVEIIKAISECYRKADPETKKASSIQILRLFEALRPFQIEFGLSGLERHLIRFGDRTVEFYKHCQEQFLTDKDVDFLKSKKAETIKSLVDAVDSIGWEYCLVVGGEEQYKTCDRQAILDFAYFSEWIFPGLNNSMLVNTNVWDVSKLEPWEAFSFFIGWGNPVDAIENYGKYAKKLPKSAGDYAAESAGHYFAIRRKSIPQQIKVGDVILTEISPRCGRWDEGTFYPEYDYFLYPEEGSFPTDDEWRLFFSHFCDCDSDMWKVIAKVIAVEKYLRTEGQKTMLLDMGLSTADLLRGRHANNSIVSEILSDWNKKLGFEAFR